MLKRVKLHAQLRAGEAELAALRIVIARLQERVDDSAPDSQEAAEIIAAYAQRCCRLVAELERLR